MLKQPKLFRYVKEFHLSYMSLDDQIKSNGPKTMKSKIMFQAIEPHQVSTTQRVSGEFGISPFSMVCHFYNHSKSIQNCGILLHFTKVLQNFWLTEVVPHATKIFQNFWLTVPHITKIWQNFWLTLIKIIQSNRTKSTMLVNQELLICSFYFYFYFLILELIDRYIFNLVFAYMNVCVIKFIDVRNEWKLPHQPKDELL